MGGGKKIRRKVETVEDVIRMATRVQARLAKQGVELSWRVSWLPMKARPEKDKP